MAAEKRIYSTTALQNCYRALRSARWSVRLKDKKVTKRRLDIQLRNCKRFLLYQFDEIEKDIADASLAKSS